MILIDPPKLFVAWHSGIRIFVARRYATWTGIGCWSLEIVWPRPGYVLPRERH